MIDNIRELRYCSLRCHVATNQEFYRVEYMCQAMGFNTLFDGIYASAHLGCRKPDPAFYAAVMDRLEGLTPEEILLWDDSLANVEAARQFGIHAEHYQSLADFEVKMQRYLST